MSTLTLAEIAAVESALASPDPRAVLDAVKAFDGASLHYDVRCAMWACGMTLAYGPTGLHMSWTGEGGYPTPEAFATFPRIAESMDAARARVANLIHTARREART